MKKSYSDFSWVIFFIIALIFFKLSVLGLYLVPSPSMQPALLPGDRIIANKLAFGLILPFMSHQIIYWSSPQRGDIILFSFAQQNEIYVKRVIGLPGDFITFRKGVVFVNNKPMNLQIHPNQNLQDNESVLYQEQNLALLKSPHLIYLAKEPSHTFFESRRFLVPPHKLFVLGDNRDHSSDSRVYGYVDEQRVYGKVSFVLFSTTGQNLLPQFRKERTFTTVSSHF